MEEQRRVLPPPVVINDHPAPEPQRQGQETVYSLLHQRDPNDPYFADERKQELLINVQVA